MSQISSFFGNQPGLTAAVETYEAAIFWGIQASITWWSALIDAAAVDSGNSPTWRLRPGLLMGQIAATGKWTNYSPTATNGSEVAAGVLAYGMRMQDVLTGSNTDKYYAIGIGGRLHSAKILGLDNMARAQMALYFRFDDNLAGRPDFPALRFQTKTANYTLVAADNFSEFNTLGAVGEVDFTLPAIASGYKFLFHNQAAQTMKVISAEGANIIALNNLTASSLAFSTGGQQIGGGLRVYSNPAGTKWIAELLNSGVAAVTVA